MAKCSFCGHENPEGLSACEACKTDLAAAAVGGSDVPEEELEVPTLHLGKLGMVQNLSRESPDRGAGEPEKPKSKPDLRTPTPASEPTSTTPVGVQTKPKARLVVIRGEKVDMQYPLYPGKNYLGRTDEKPVDVDLECQEPADRIWTSRQHAVVSLENEVVTIEDLNSLNGTFVNRTRVHPGQVRTLQPNDIIQVGTVQLRFVVG